MQITTLTSRCKSLAEIQRVLKEHSSASVNTRVSMVVNTRVLKEALAPEAKSLARILKVLIEHSSASVVTRVPVADNTRVLTYSLEC